MFFKSFPLTPTPLTLTLTRPISAIDLMNLLTNLEIGMIQFLLLPHV